VGRQRDFSAVITMCCYSGSAWVVISTHLAPPALERCGVSRSPHSRRQGFLRLALRVAQVRLLV
jgi:hypothetical protein